jgi:hypothetical protein
MDGMATVNGKAFPATLPNALASLVHMQEGQKR